MDSVVEFDPFAGAAIERAVATTPAQREVWLADRLGAHASLCYNEAISLAFEGSLDEAALQRALEELAARHECLRSVFSGDGEQMLIQTAASVALTHVDLRGLALEAQQRQLAQLHDAAVSTVFDLAAGPLWRCALIRLADQRHQLQICAHHLVCDGWSFGVLAQDLAHLYSGAVGHALGKLSDADSYVGYASAEAERRDSTQARADLDWWCKQFAGPVPVLELPADRARPALRTFESRRIDRPLPPRLVEQLRHRAKSERCSLFALMLSAFQLLLARLSGTTDVVVGVPAAGQAANQMPRLIGHCVKLLPIRGDVPLGKPLGELLRATQSAFLDAFEHQAIGFGELLEQLPIERDPSRLPLVSVMFNLDQPLPENKMRFAGLRTELDSIARRYENFELFVNCSQLADESIRVECQYNVALFDARSIERWLDGFELLLRAVADDARVEAARAPLTTPDDLEQLARLNRPAERFDTPAELSRLLRGGALNHPLEPALRIIDADGETAASMNHREVDTLALALAARFRQRLQQSGTSSADARIGLCMDRDAPMWLAQLASLHAGITYVPLDPAYPSQRLAHMARDAALAYVVADQLGAQALDSFGWPAERRLDVVAELGAIGQQSPSPNTSDRLVWAAADAEHAAYVIYTSGSTGLPKGVAVPRRAVSNFLASMLREPGIQCGDCVVAVTTLSFDIAVLELLGPPAAGAELILAGRDQAGDGAALAALLHASRATILQATPGSWRMLLSAGWQAPPGFKGLIGGEALPVDLADTLTSAGVALWNMYGPTETTVWSTCWSVDRAPRSVRIGRPIAATSVWILDEQGACCPIGVAGEICIGGAGVALGYLNQPELTAQRFTADPFSARAGARIYRTGDRGRWCNDGLLEHLGRLDAQIKLRGFRIEPGEIEHALAQHPAIAQAVVVVQDFGVADQRLCAYCVARAGQSWPEVAALREFLGATLPGYMIPQQFAVLDAIPLLPNGKIDRQALAKTSLVARSATEPATRRAPSGDLERTVAELMARTLAIAEVGADDNFFMLGGHSLLAARLVNALNEALPADAAKIPLRAAFEAPSCAALAAWIERNRTTRTPDAPASTPIPRLPEQQNPPLSLMQQRLWFVESLQPGRVVFNTPSAHRLTGALNESAFNRAFNTLIARQPVLRTSIEAPDGAPEQIIAEEFQVELFPATDLSGIEPVRREAALLSELDHLTQEPIAIDTLPLFRTRMFKLDQHEHVWFFMPHHIIWDGWSFDIMYRELAAHYESFCRSDSPAPLAPLSVRYGDFAAWHRDWLAGEELHRQLQWWRERLVISPAPIALPANRPRPPLMTGDGGTHWLELDAAVLQATRDRVRRHGATLFMGLLAAWAALLARICGESRMTIGTPVHGRNRPELEPILGFFVNALPLQFDVDTGQGFDRLLEQVQAQVTGAFAHPDVPFEQLLRALGTRRSEQHFPIYQTFFSYQDGRERIRAWGNLSHRPLLLLQPGVAEDLGLWFLELDGRAHGGLQYNGQIFDPNTVGDIARAYIELLRAMLAEPTLPLREHALHAQAEFDRLRQLSTSSVELAPQTRHGGVAPIAATPTDDDRMRATVAEVWRRLLQIDRINPSDNFLNLGGHSMLAMQAIAELERITGKRVNPRRFIFESLEQIAHAYQQGGDAAPKAAGLLGRLFGRRA